ncbi:predicted Rossmann fold nucleotide-binding protein [Longilinea arvoryzae]|uniref:Predicted Rossmann fold nucleotide-binding protein n=1 Tax=Longilinea arvoryzae TaxID=360412 RepID=A0A0S7BMT9_9CHLR|nr:LOG family protein [Longilinea arvoryzae]GAP15265.1 predicted Rossmann fold nucleotide-binding protein [Longilinea arvoryzae]
MRVTVFGGTHTQPGETDYEEAVKLGRLLGERGCTVLTGGYIGTMEAVSRGAAEAGAHVIGITCEEIERFRPGSANRWVQEEQRFPQLVERINGLIDGSDAAMALPGGVGTLAEVTVTWNRMLIGSIPPRPLILVGMGWRKVIDSFFTSQGEYIAARDHQWVQFASDVEQAVALLPPPAGRPV